MSKYTLLGKNVSFSDSADEFCKVQFLAWDLSAKCKNEFNTWYDSKGDIYEVLKNYFDKLQGLIEKRVLMTMIYTNLKGGEHPALDQNPCKGHYHRL